MISAIHSRPFGILPTGQPVEAWTLNGAGGLVLEAITYGGIITRLLVPDRDGKLGDVVLGFNTLNEYVAGHPYFGAIVGRTAGRITGAKFRIEGKTYELLANDPPNHLHGGARGFDKKIWTAMRVERPDGAPSLRLAYCSPDGEEGYPGRLEVSVAYTVTPDNALVIEIEGSSDRQTPFNLTQHSYFNLGGEAAGSIADHELELYADEYVVTDEHMTLLGRVESVNGRGNDFRQPRRLEDAIPLLFLNHGDLYPLPKTGRDVPVAAARLAHPGTGRTLTVFTTETHIQLYTGCGLDGSLIGKSGHAYGRHAAVCLECEGYPDGVNAPNLGDIVLRPGEPRRKVTSYHFST